MSQTVVAAGVSSGLDISAIALDALPISEPAAPRCRQGVRHHG